MIIDTSLVMFFVLMYFFDLNNWFILIIGFFITPQIVHNALKGNNPKFISKYIFGILATNIFIPVFQIIISNSYILGAVQVILEV